MLAATMVLPLAGCKDTDVLTEEIFDPINGELDETLDPIYTEAPNSEVADDLSLTEQESPREDELTETQATYSEDPSDNQQTTEQGIQSNDESNGDAQGGTAAGTGNSTVSGTQSTINSDTTKPTELTTDDITDNTTQPDSSQQQQQSPDKGAATPNPSTPSGGNGGQAQVYGSDGTYTDLPENTKRIAAVGQCAQIVCMLAGGDANHASPLVAADYNFLAEIDEKGVFPGEGVGLQAGTTAAWTGSEGNWSLDLTALTQAKPDVVLVSKGSSAINDEVSQQLTAAGINVVLMPQLGNAYTLDADIDKAVQVVGELLKNANTVYDTRAAADKYVNTKTSLKNQLTDSAHNNGFTTYASVYGTGMSNCLLQGKWGTGTPTTNVSTNRSFTAYFDGWAENSGMCSVASQERWIWGRGLYPLEDSRNCDIPSVLVDVSDGVGVYFPQWDTASAASTNNNCFPLISYYFQWGGVSDTSLWACSMSRNPLLGGWMIPGTGDSFSREYFTNSTDRSLLSAPGTLWYHISDTFVSADNYAQFVTAGKPGDNFPGVIVRDVSTGNNIKFSSQKPNGEYNVGYDYSIWVMPSGLGGSWSDGTVESFFVSAWTWGLFNQGGNVSDAQVLYQDFCSDFYRSGAVADLTVSV